MEGLCLWYNHLRITRIINADRTTSLIYCKPSQFPIELHIFAIYYLILGNSVSLVKRIQGHTFQSITWDALRREPTGPNQSVSPVVNYSQKVERLIRWPKKVHVAQWWPGAWDTTFWSSPHEFTKRGGEGTSSFPMGLRLRYQQRHHQRLYPNNEKKELRQPDYKREQARDFSFGYSYAARLLPPLQFTGVRSIRRLNKFRFIIDLQWIDDRGRRIQITQSFQWKTCEPTGRRDLFKRRLGSLSSSISPSFSFIFGFKVKALPGILLHPLRKGRDSSVRHVSHSNPPLTQRPLLD